MIWDARDQAAMRGIMAAVWVTFHMAVPIPRRITARWTTRPRGKSLPLPLPRSWLGGRTTDPHHTPHKPHTH